MGLIEGGVALPHFEAVFGYTKARYRGLKKNHEWLLAALALVYLYQYRKRLVPGVVSPRPEMRPSKTNIHRPVRKYLL